MEPKTKPTNTNNRNTNANTNTNTNNNVNNNVTNNHFVFPEPLVKSSEKKSNWLLKSIIGGIITVIVTLAIYYGKQNLNNHNRAIQNDLPPVTGTKQTKN